MRRKGKISILQLLIMGVLLVFASSCEKDDDNITTNGKTTAVFNSNITYGTMTDQDGNVYKTVTIGTQTWMAENLRTTIYNDGTPIPNVTDNDKWAALTSDAYCNYDNTANLEAIATYGRLYNWYAVNTGKLAPIGWHVPSDDEWTTLTNYLRTNEGGKLKETGTMDLGNNTNHWISPNTDATNGSGFTALPGGCRTNSGLSIGIFQAKGFKGYWWSATGYSTDNAWARYVLYQYSSVYSYGGGKMEGFSVRCVKD